MFADNMLPQWENSDLQEVLENGKGVSSVPPFA